MEMLVRVVVVEAPALTMAKIRAGLGALVF
jgi:hypothetical protein